MLCKLYSLQINKLKSLILHYQYRKIKYNNDNSKVKVFYHFKPIHIKVIQLTFTQKLI